MGCDGFFVDRRDLEDRKRWATVLRAHWATIENGHRLMKMWDIAKRGDTFTQGSEYNWEDLNSLAEVAWISSSIMPADLSDYMDLTNELPLTIGDMLDQSDHGTLVILDWETRSVQEYTGEIIREIFYSEAEQ